MHSEDYSSCCVCECVCLLSHISPLELLFVVTEGNKGQNICGVFYENALLVRLSAPSLGWHAYCRPFFLRITCMCIVHMQGLDDVMDAPCCKLSLHSI